MDPMTLLAVLKTRAARWLIALALIAALLAYAGVQSARLHHAKADLAAARAALYVPGTRQTWESTEHKAVADLTTCQSGLADTTGALERQSAAVAALKADGDRRAAAAAQGLQAARNQAQAARSAADRILKAQPTGDLCARMLDVERSISENSK